MPTKPKRKPPVRTYDVHLTGELDGFELTFRGVSATDYIALTGGELSNEAGINLVIDHVIDHNFDVEDLHDLEIWIVMAILAAWGSTLTERSFPPDSATS